MRVEINKQFIAALKTASQAGGAHAAELLIRPEIQYGDELGKMIRERVEEVYQARAIILDFIQCNSSGLEDQHV